MPTCLPAHDNQSQARVNVLYLLTLNSDYEPLHVFS